MSTSMRSQTLSIYIFIYADHFSFNNDTMFINKEWLQRPLKDVCDIACFVRGPARNLFCGANKGAHYIQTYKILHQ